MGPDLFQQFWQRARRNLFIGTALSILPAGAFYFFVFPFSAWQLGVLCLLGLLDIAAFLPLDVWILKRTLTPVERALAPAASADLQRAGMARLLDSPRYVLWRVYWAHAPLASLGISVLVIVANYFFALGVPPATFPLYWLLNLTVVPVAHVVYEFAAMERAVQPLIHELAQRGVRPADSGAPPFTLNRRMVVFFPGLALSPILIVIFSIVARSRSPHAPPLSLWDLAAIGFGCVAVISYLMFTLGSQLRDQTAALVGVLDRLGRGDLKARSELYTTSEFGQLAGHVNDMAVGLGERERLRDLFGAYMTAEVAHDLLARGEDTEGRTDKRFVAIMFVDVRGFTAFSNNREPEVVVGVLNRFFEQAVEAITANGGTVNKYLGDGLLAIFGAPVRLPNPCASAIAAAAEMVRRLDSINVQFAAENLPPVAIGVGIHAGEVVVGTIGAQRHKLEYTVIGDAVNVASRIEQLTKKLGVAVLVSAEALAAAGADWQRRAGAPASEQVKGVERPVVVHAIPTEASARSGA